MTTRIASYHIEFELQYESLNNTTDEVKQEVQNKLLPIFVEASEKLKEQGFKNIKFAFPYRVIY